MGDFQQKFPPHVLLPVEADREMSGGFLLSRSFTEKRATKIFLSALVVCLLLLTLSCSSRHKITQANSIETHEVLDELGRHLRIHEPVQRVVSLAPNLTEIVYAVGAGDHLVGDTTYCDYPAEAKRVAKVGDTLHPNIESIIALRPQVVLVSTSSQLESFTRQLDEQQIAVYVTDAHDLETTFRSIAHVGELLGKREEAEKLVQELRARAAIVEERVRGKKLVRVFYQLSAEPLYTAGKSSYITDMIRRAGGLSVTENVEGDWPRLSDETALAAEPEAIILATADSMGTGNNDVAAPLRKSPAALNGRVYRINGDYLSRQGPRLVDGLEQMARALHPESFLER